LSKAQKSESAFGFPKSHRLLSRGDFDSVYNSDHFAADDVLVIRAARNDLGRTRLGLSVSRKVGNAVARNRWKRLIREAFRLQQHDLPTGMDIVVRPRKGACCDYEAIRNSIVKLSVRLKRKTK
jgi:ribonuclease P protein component